MFLKTTVTTILTYLNTLVTNARKSAVVITVGCCDFNQTPEIRIVVTAPNPLFPTNLKCHENLSTGSRVVTCGRAERWRDMMKVIGAFRKSANAPLKKYPTFAMSTKGLRIYCFRRLHNEFDKIVPRILEL